MITSFLVAAKTVCALLVLMAIGYYGAKVKILDEAGTKKLSAIVINIAQPFMLFNALTKVEYSDDNLKTGLLTLCIGLLSHAILSVLAWFMAKFQPDEIERKYTEFSIIFVNAGFLGLPIMNALLGNIGGFWCAFYVVAFNLTVWSYGQLLLSRGRGKTKFQPLKLILNYGTTPCLVGLLFYIMQWKLPAPLTSAVQYMDNICTPLVLLTIGANLTRLPLGKMFTNVRLYLLSFLRLLVCPAIVGILYHIFGMSDERVIFFTVMASLPTAALTVMFAELGNERPDFAAQTVSITTFLSMFTIPLTVLMANLLIQLPQVF